MYPYHNQIKKRINNRELVGYEYTDSYPRIGKALVLYFSTQPFRKPIRPNKWDEYKGMLDGVPYKMG